MPDLGRTGDERAASRAWWTAAGILFALSCALRVAGLDWNLAALHSAAGPAAIPTYHIDEWLLLDGLRSEFRLFSRYSLLTDGPLSVNLLYLALRALGMSSAAEWNGDLALGVGRIMSAVADCASLLVLGVLLRTLKVSRAVTFAVLAITALAPNHVFNAHFARSHTIANLLQLVVVLAAARSMLAAQAGGRAGWLFTAVLVAVLAGSARYPFLTLGIFPAAAMIFLLARAPAPARVRTAAWLAATGAAATLLGVAVGFGMMPIEILRAGFQSQSAVGQLPWGEVRAIVRSAVSKVASTLEFAGGGARALLLVATPLAFLTGRGRAEAARREVRPVAVLVAACSVAWALMYLVLWAKFSVPWQRYSIPFSTALLVPGALGLDAVREWAGAWLRGRGARPVAIARAAAAAGGVALLASPAYMSALVVDRTVRDETNPHYELSRVLHELGPGRVYVNHFWAWNRMVLQQIAPPAEVEWRFVPDLAQACAEARPGDVVVDFVIERLSGECSARELATHAELSNAGPGGYPFPARGEAELWLNRHFEDYHYVFEQIRVRRFTGGAAARRAGAAQP